ncbi:hypothetical protein BDQ94DRAFT_175837 [Aspergillus welwitschiae]|uniref:Uncharacterized protein n=1 Tax=Aspergillus welwitschiae TaxID=1341132 RepID=A0A3F3PKF2_9EURO|nr:hypothetical protein BDQ94DRAFT_175837 [Aspergillus welwitschiae]RDH27192.1 hypothetical protein BDQ94DRAFT_175837 [Aspergillus welwitschiae]
MEFDKSIYDEVKHNTKVIINDIEYQGFGVGKANNGLLTSQLNHDLNFDPEILAVHLIVGYPSYSEYKEGATDLFKPSTLLGGYKYQRKYRFSNGATFSSFHNISFDKKKGLSSCFTTRDFPSEAFAGQTWDVQDLVETFIPSGPGLIKSVIAVEWKGDQRNLSAVIESEYYLNHNLELPGLHWRNVTFRTDKAVKGIYIQSEKITIHRDLKEVGGEPENLLARQLPVETKGREKAREEAEATQLNAAVAVSTF